MHGLHAVDILYVCLSIIFDYVSIFKCNYHPSMELSADGQMEAIH